MAVWHSVGLNHDTNFRHLYRVPGRAGAVLCIVEYHCCCCAPEEEQKEKENGKKVL